MNEIDTLITQFQERRSSHPELSLMWINYLTIKKNKMLEIKERAKQALECMNEINDISLQTIMTIYTINDII